jgi:glycerophosphoryl diester phosphodiesterase
MSQTQPFLVIGHRGCRGLMPENTLPAFEKAVDLGILHLELDVVISGDSQVVVSHEPWISNQICVDANGNPLELFSKERYNIYKMPYHEIAQYNCGSKRHEGFPEQHKMKASKPLLKDVIQLMDHYAYMKWNKLPVYYIEIKSKESWYSVFQPEPERYLEKVIQVLNSFNAVDRFIIQSFDINVLKLIHQNYAEYSVSALNEKTRSAEEFINKLGFKPQFYSPWYPLVTKKSVRYCTLNQIKVIPWTVNNDQKFNQLKSYGVSGIITDYPDRFR